MITMQAFSAPYYIMLLAIVAISLLLYIAFRNKSMQARRNTLLFISGTMLVLFVIYKIILATDEEYLALEGYEHFVLLFELPMHLCNINMILLPVSILLINKPLMLFSFSTATLGAFLALSFPDMAFVGYSLFTPRVIFYYLIHSLLIVCAVSLVSFGFYRPRFKDIPMTLGLFFLIGLAAHGVNLLIRTTTGIAANYFYTCEPDSVALEFFWELIPVPFVYLLIPAYIIFPTYLLLICLVFRLIEKRKADGKLKAK